MIGNGGGGRNEFGNLFSLLQLVQEDGAYEKKLRELSARQDAADQTFTEAANNNRRAEETHKLAEEMVNKANEVLKEAKESKKKQDAKELELAEREKKLAEAAAAHERSVKEFQVHIQETHKKLSDDRADLENQREIHGGALKALEQAKLEFEAECNRVRAFVSSEKDKILGRASQELEKAAEARRVAEAHAEALEQKRKSYEEFISKMASA